MNECFIEIIFLAAIVLCWFLLAMWTEKKFKFSVEQSTILFFCLLLILIGSFAVYTGDGGYHRGYPVPLWGASLFLIIGIIMLIMIIHYWCKQKKTQVLNNDENAEAEAAQENLLADDAQQPLEDKDKNQP